MNFKLVLYCFFSTSEQLIKNCSDPILSKTECWYLIIFSGMVHPAMEPYCHEDYSHDVASTSLNNLGNFDSP
jgi:hypothetical protein